MVHFEAKARRMRKLAEIAKQIQAELPWIVNLHDETEKEESIETLTYDFNVAERFHPVKTCKTRYKIDSADAVEAVEMALYGCGFKGSEFKGLRDNEVYKTNLLNHLGRRLQIEFGEGIMEDIGNHLTPEQIVRKYWLVNRLDSNYIGISLTREDAIVAVNRALFGTYNTGGSYKGLVQKN